MIKIKVTYASGRECEFTAEGSTFREATNRFLNHKWIINENGAINFDYVESIIEIKQ